MNGGAKFLAAAAVVAIAACTNQGKLEVRPTASRSAASDAPVPEKLAEGYAQLKLGNAGLANELFRKALREDPASAEANAGLAASYDRMGRFDLSRRYFEAALAIAPADPRLLERFADSLDRQGAREEAAGVRAEIAARLAQAEQAETQAFVEAMAPAEQVPLMADAAPPEPRAVVAMAPPVQVAQAPIVEPSAVAAPVAHVPASKISSVAAPAAHAPVARPSPVAAPVAAASVTIKLPPARPAPAPAVADTGPIAPAPFAIGFAAIASAPVAPDVVVPEKPATPVRADRRRPGSPRLQRLTLAEVELVTTGVSRWRPHVVAQNKQSTTIRFVPLKKPQQQAFAGVRLLNAARSHGLAARTRDYLAAKGWRRLAIGNASETRETSVILFPESRRRTAEILAAQFRIRVARRAGKDQAIVVLLGRDASRVKANRTSA